METRLSVQNIHVEFDRQLSAYYKPIDEAGGWQKWVDRHDEIFAAATRKP